MRLVTALLLPVLLCLGCSGVNLDVTPTLTPLKVRLGGKPTPTVAELERQLEDERRKGQDLLTRVAEEGYSVYSGVKTWPWPVQTSLAKQLKEVHRIEGELLLRPTLTPNPAWTPTPSPDTVLTALAEPWPTNNPAERAKAVLTLTALAEKGLSFTDHTLTVVAAPTPSPVLVLTAFAVPSPTPTP